MKRSLSYTIKKAVMRVLGKRMVRCIINYNVNRNYASSRLKKLLLTFLYIVPGFISYFKSTIPYIEMDVTTRCSLNCKECTHLIPVYNSRGIAGDYDIATLLENIDLLLSKVNKCLMFRITGGEPFIYDKLPEVLNKLAGEPKIKNVEIATNGTVLPCNDTLKALCHSKFSVSVSNYEALSKSKDEIFRICTELGINVKISDLLWYETNSLVLRNYTKKEIKSVFFNCIGSEFKFLYEGKLWLCPQAMHGSLLGLLSENESEYIDLRKSSKKGFRKQLNNLYRYSDKITSCRYCTGVCPEFSKQIPCAEQADRSIAI